MRRRVDESQQPVPPDVLIDYQLWCLRKGRRAYGAKADGSWREAVAAWDAWEAEREVWAAAHGVDEDVPGLAGDPPFDWDAI